MFKRASTALVLLLASVGLVLGMDYATYAGTGDSLILGKVNKSKKTTVIKSTGKGPALSLKSKPGAAPLAVSNGNKVLNLNADSVDGLDGQALSNDTQRYTFDQLGQHFTSATFNTPPIAPGTYLVTFRTSIENTQSGNVQCRLIVAGKDYAGDMVQYTSGYAAMMSGADVITIAAATPVSAKCDTLNGAFSLYNPLRVSLTRTNLVADGSLTKS